MKVKVGNNIYSGDKEPVMVILTDKDKKNIAKMLPQAKKYCEYPDDAFENNNEVLRWMEKE